MAAATDATFDPAMPSAEATAAVVQDALGVVYRRIRQTKVINDLSLPESSALSRLRHGPTTSAELAKLEQISPQSMGTTIAALEQKGLISRTPDPRDGRRLILSLTPTGADTVATKRGHRARQMTAALQQFTPAERRQLLEALPLLDKLAEHMPDAAPETT